MRKTTQTLLPRTHAPTPPGQYDIYPAFPIGDGQIATGFDALAAHLVNAKSTVAIDGYVGVLWDDLRQRLDAALRARGVRAHWIDVADAMLPADAVDDLVTPFLGGDDPIFGTRFTGTLRDFFNTEKLAAIRPNPTTDLTLIYGCGAALVDLDSTLVYVDLPKNEVQFRARAGSITSLGATQPEHHKHMYKRFYFVDWVALNRHKAELLPRIDLIVDAQRPDDITLATGEALRRALHAMSHSYFRVRPWFEPGAWGGQWMKRNIPQLPQEPVNYAWSFELIVPENGLLLQSDGVLLEISFDFLMFYDSTAVIGDSAELFGYEFPIRFDFLDTVEGGNLSVQVHPRPDFIREQFGETFTQDETYYILDCTDDAVVYLGFQDGIEPATFRAALETSHAQKQPIDIPDFVQVHPARKHDLFLIPHGTIHCSGSGNLVLEISATPYIFTFKMYDWLRLDLDGKPRPLNIERAFANLNFERQGARVTEELIPQATPIASGDGWRLAHLPTHRDHFYDVHRFELAPDSHVEVATDGSCHVLSLVEGRTLRLDVSGRQADFNYAETFVVSAAAGSYRLVNTSGTPIKVIKAFVKADARL